MDDSVAEPDRYSALYRVARAINATLDLDEVLHLVARNVTESVGVRACAIRLRAPGGTLDLVAAHGLSADYLAKGEIRADAASAAEDALSGRSVVAQVDDPGAWQYPDAARLEGIATSCTVPLLIDGAPIGILRVYAAERREFSRRDIEFLEALGDLSALAIKNAQRHKAIRDDFAFIQEYTFGIHPTDR